MHTSLAVKIVLNGSDEFGSLKKMINVAFARSADERTWKATALSAARAMCARVAHCVRPQIVPKNISHVYNLGNFAHSSRRSCRAAQLNEPRAELSQVGE